MSTHAQASSGPAERLGVLIADARGRKKLTQVELARRLGLENPASSRTLVSAWETGRGVPPGGRVKALCDILGLDKTEVTRFCFAHKRGNIDPEVAESMVREEGARYEKAPGASPLATALARLDRPRRDRVLKQALQLAEVELQEQETEKE